MINRLYRILLLAGRVTLKLTTPGIGISSKTWTSCRLTLPFRHLALAHPLPSSFKTSGYWLSFINVPLFFRDLQDPNMRGGLQPLVLSGLAMAILMKSSELELGSRGRDLALTLRNRAQGCVEEVCRSQNLDYTLAKAALVSGPNVLHSISLTRLPRFSRCSSPPVTLCTHRKTQAMRSGSSTRSFTFFPSAQWIATTRS